MPKSPGLAILLAEGKNSKKKNDSEDEKYSGKDALYRAIKQIVRECIAETEETDSTEE